MSNMQHRMYCLGILLDLVLRPVRAANGRLQHQVAGQELKLFITISVSSEFALAIKPTSLIDNYECAGLTNLRLER